MTSKYAQKCLQCEKTESLLWRPTGSGNICQECYEQNSNKIKAEDDNENSNGNNADEKKVRKSTRSTRYKPRIAVTSKAITKGRSRRCIFKKTPIKAPAATAVTHTVRTVFYKGSYLQIGDIVSLMDAKNNLYYAQIRGLLIDTYCEKSAFLTWLIPTKFSPPSNKCFDPSTYIIGPDEDHPRRLSCLEFVMHAPSSYYHDKTNPFPPPGILDFDSSPIGFIWTNLNGNEGKWE